MNTQAQHLYIIGNGFDLSHRDKFGNQVQTSYENFGKWLKETDEFIYARFQQAYGLFKENDWRYFEDRLGEISPRAILNGIPNTVMIEENPNASISNCWEILSFDDESMILGDLYCGEVLGSVDKLYQYLSSLFYDWFAQMNFSSIIPNPIWNIIDGNKSLFINFNYTDILQRVYGIPEGNILHIHGCVNQSKRLIFGHGKSRQNLIDEWGESYTYIDKEDLEDAAQQLATIYKPIHDIIINNADFLNSLGDLKHIHIWGKALFGVDYPYFEYLTNSLRDKEVHWEFSYHPTEDNRDLKNIDSFVKKFNIASYTVLESK